MNEMLEKWVNLVIVGLCCGLALVLLILLTRDLPNGGTVLIDFNVIGEYTLVVITTVIIVIGSLIWFIRLSSRKWYETNI